MSLVTRIALILASALAFVAISATLAHADVQEVFICKVKEGKSVEEVMKVGGEFKAAIKALPGGSDYQARVLTPVASGNLGNIVWVGAMGSFSALAAFNDAYNASEVGEKYDAKFQELVNCESRSFWQIHDVE